MKRVIEFDDRNEVLQSVTFYRVWALRVTSNDQGLNQEASEELFDSKEKGI